MEHTVSLADFDNFYPEVDLAGSTGNKTYKKLILRVDPVNPSRSIYNVYFSGELTHSTTDFEEAIKTYNSLSE